MKRYLATFVAFTFLIAIPSFAQAAVGFDLPGGALTNPISNIGNLEFFVIIPEPGTLTLLGVAGAGLLLRRRRQG